MGIRASIQGGDRFLELGGLRRVVAGHEGMGRGEGVPLPPRVGFWEGAVFPSPENFWTFAFKTVHSGAF